jgi:hypothetical protein
MTVVLATPVLCMYVKMIVLSTSVPLAEAFTVYQHSGSFLQTLYKNTEIPCTKFYSEKINFGRNITVLNCGCRIAVPQYGKCVHADI